MSSKRGLIIIPRLTLHGIDECPYNATNSFTARQIYLGDEIEIDLWIQPDDLRQYLLYWDLITIPKIKFDLGGSISGPYLYDNDLLKLHQYSIFNIAEVQYAIEQSKSDSSTASNNFCDLKKVYSIAQDNLLKTMNDETEVIWSLGQTGTDLLKRSDHSLLGTSVEFCFLDSLPCPTEDTAIDDILEFKEKRNPELLRFRNRLDQLCEKVLKSENQTEQIKKSVEQINIALIDINKLLNESKLKTIIRHIKMSLDLKESTLIKAVSAIIGASSTMSIDLPATYGALGGVAITGLFEMILKEKSLNLPEQSKDFAYLYYLKRKYKTE